MKRILLPLLLLLILSTIDQTASKETMNTSKASIATYELKLPNIDCAFDYKLLPGNITWFLGTTSTVKDIPADIEVK